MTSTLALPDHQFFTIFAWLKVKLDERAHKTPGTRRLKIDELYFFPNQIRKVVRPLGVSVQCLKGSVWITIDGDLRDIVLCAGQSIVLDRDQPTLIMAMEQAHVLYMDGVAA